MICLSIKVDSVDMFVSPVKKQRFLKKKKNLAESCNDA